MIIGESFSQFQEDVLIAAALAGTGQSYSPYMVDVGANDGRSWSNSYFYGQKDWDLLLIEPVPKFAQLCRDYYHGNSKVIVEEKAVSHQTGSVEFFITDEPDRDLLQMGSSLTAAGVPFGLRSTRVVVETAPLETLLRAHNVPKDYAILSVDAEGHDLGVLETAGFGEWSPRVVCVEMIYSTPMEEAYQPIDDFLRSKGYRYTLSTPANGIYTLKV